MFRKEENSSVREKNGPKKRYLLSVCTPSGPKVRDCDSKTNSTALFFAENSYAIAEGLRFNSNYLRYYRVREKYSCPIRKICLFEDLAILYMTILYNTLNSLVSNIP